MTDRLPAMLGGTPAFPEGLALARPTIEDAPMLGRRLETILASGILTNGPTVRSLEQVVAQRLGVQHVVAVSSCTSGLMLVLQALGVTGRVVLPSFTFAASAHAVVWSGGQPVFAEVDPHRLTLDPDDTAGLLDGAAAIMATHVYGAPAQIERLQALADAAAVPLVFDAAHALGSMHGATPVGGFGAAEVFSLSPTKVACGGEGGLVSTNDAGLAEAVRIGRDYGNPGDYDCVFPGLNARMSELHAAVALASLECLDRWVAHRNALVRGFTAAVADVSGLRFQLIDEGDLSTYKDLTVLIDAATFGLTAASLACALAKEGIDTRRYFFPATHHQKAYAHLPWSRELPVTDMVAEQVLTVPLWSHMSYQQIERLADAVTRIQQHAGVSR